MRAPVQGIVSSPVAPPGPRTLDTRAPTEEASDMDLFTTDSLQTADGVRLAVHHRPGPPGGPTLLLSNGLGGNLQTFRHLVRAFSRTHRIVSWDYRGLYGSTLPVGSQHVPVDIGTQAEDALAVLRHFEVGRAVLVGWSMGVQLNFDLWARASAAGVRIDGIVALSGGFGRTLAHTIGGPMAERLIRPGLTVFEQVMTRAGHLLTRPEPQRFLIDAARAVGLVAPEIDEDVFGGLVGDYVGLDFATYKRILAALGDHDVEHLLARIDVPVLVVAGDRDPMTPRRVSEHMVHTIPQAELMIVPSGTHYLPVEYPDLINVRVDKFLRTRVGHASAAASAAI